MHEPRESNDKKAERKSPSNDDLNLVGTPFRRVDGRAKVTGQTRFADDLTFPRMVHMKLRLLIPTRTIASRMICRAASEEMSLCD